MIKGVKKCYSSTKGWYPPNVSQKCQKYGDLYVPFACIDEKNMYSLLMLWNCILQPKERRRKYRRIFTNVKENVKLLWKASLKSKCLKIAQKISFYSKLVRAKRVYSFWTQATYVMINPNKLCSLRSKKWGFFWSFSNRVKKCFLFFCVRKN